MDARYLVALAIWAACHGITSEAYAEAIGCRRYEAHAQLCSVEIAMASIVYGAA